MACHACGSTTHSRTTHRDCPANTNHLRTSNPGSLIFVDASRAITNVNNVHEQTIAPDSVVPTRRTHDEAFQQPAEQQGTIQIRSVPQPVTSLQPEPAAAQQQPRIDTFTVHTPFVARVHPDHYVPHGNRRSNILPNGGQDLGEMNVICSSCNAKMWIKEKSAGTIAEPKFTFYASARNFRQKIHLYNCAFAFFSIAAKYHSQLANEREGVYTFRVNGMISHSIAWAIQPAENVAPGFAQFYIYDTESQIQLRNGLFDGLDTETLRSLQTMINRDNPLSQVYQRAADRIQESPDSDFAIVIHSDRTPSRGHYGQYLVPATAEIAAILPNHGSVGAYCDVVITRRGGGLMRINEFHPLYDPTYYVLIFPRGEQGWVAPLPNSHPNNMSNVSNNDPDDEDNEDDDEGNTTPMRYYAYLLHDRDKYYIVYYQRLFHQFVVDMWVKVEQHHLEYIHRNQTSLHAEMLDGFVDAIDGEIARNVRRSFLLPSTFIGGSRDMNSRYQDAMAIIRCFSKPDLFITFTCNPSWIEITPELKLGQRAVDRPGLTARVFHMKLNSLMDDLTKKHVLGTYVAHISVVEHQKQGLPHCHILLILSSDCKLSGPSDYDNIVSAEIPNPDRHPAAYATVTRNIMHGACGPAYPDSPYMKTTEAEVGGYPIYRRSNDGKTVDVRRGHDHALMSMRRRCNNHSSATGTDTVDNEDDEDEIDETTLYQDARYVSASESFWRLFGFSLHSRAPFVQSLSIHLPGKKSVYYRPNQTVQQVIERAEQKLSTLEACFELNRNDPTTRELCYHQIPSQYSWNTSGTRNYWSPRTRSKAAVSRVVFVSPGDMERFSLCLLLHNVPGAQSYNDLLRYNGCEYELLQEAVAARLLLESDEEYDLCLAEAISVHRYHVNDLEPDVAHCSAQAITDINNLLLDQNSSLSQFPTLPSLPDLSSFESNIPKHLQQVEDKNIEDLGQVAEDSIRSLNADQRAIFDAVTAAIDDPTIEQRAFFLDGQGGSGKTFLYNTLLAHVQSQNKSTIAVASTGVAALLLRRGVTAHSVFKIPVENLDDSSTCSISLQSEKAQAICNASLIVWNEVPMIHRHAVEAVNRTLQDIIGATDPSLQNSLFGNKVIVFGGDFRQTLPVVKRGSRSDCINASFVRSPLCNSIRTFRLTINMQLQNLDDNNEHSELCPNSDYIFLDREQYIRGSNINNLLNVIYPNLDNHTTPDPQYFAQRAILSPKNAVVDIINDVATDRFPGECREYLSADTVPAEEYSNQIPTEFLEYIVYF
ncbi:hypothetical protein INT45_006933, partial [Circinella minor]